MADHQPADAPQGAAPNAASLIASALLIAIVCSFSWYGLMGRFAREWGWTWYAAWVGAILLPPFVYLAVRTGGARRAIAPFLFIVTIGLLLAIVFPVAIL